MKRYAEDAMQIVNKLYTEWLDYYTEYLPMADAISLLMAYEDTGLTPEEVKRACEAGRQDIPWKTGWISVKDSLPDEEDNVLLLVREVEHYGIHGRKRKVYSSVFTGWRVDDEWATFCCYGHQMLDEEDKKHPNIQFSVTHWMLLPEPPKEVNYKTYEGNHE